MVKETEPMAAPWDRDRAHSMQELIDEIIAMRQRIARLEIALARVIDNLSPYKEDIAFVDEIVREGLLEYDPKKVKPK